MRHDHPEDIRDGQLVYIERVADVAMIERDGKVENCHEAALAGSHGTTKGDNYLRHDLVPSNHCGTPAQRNRNAPYSSPEIKEKSSGIWHFLA